MPQKSADLPLVVAVMLPMVRPLESLVLVGRVPSRIFRYWNKGGSVVTSLGSHLITVAVATAVHDCGKNHGGG